MLASSSYPLGARPVNARPPSHTAIRRQPAPALCNIIRSARELNCHSGNSAAPSVPERVEVFLPGPVRKTQPQWIRRASCEPALRMRGRHVAPWHLPDAASRITLEPGLLPSTAVARPPRYYKPLRHPAGPAGPSRGSGWRVPHHRQDFPCCSRPPLPCMQPPLPRRNRPVHASFAARSMVAFPVSMAGQLPRLQFRGLLGVHSRCSPHSRRTAQGGPSPGVLQTTSLPPSSAPIATGWNDRCWAAFAPAGGPCVAGNRNFPIPGNLKLHT